MKNIVNSLIGNSLGIADQRMEYGFRTREIYRAGMAKNIVNVDFRKRLEVVGLFM